MFIEIEGLKDKPRRVQHVFPVDEIPFQHEDAWLDSPVAVDFKLTPDGRELRVRGKMETSVRCRCSRCAKEFARPVVAEFDLSYTPQPDWGGGASEVELEYGDMDVGYYDGVSFDVNTMALEQIELAMPMQYVCRDNCKGLCYRCGADLNEGSCSCEEEPDARLSALLQWRERRAGG
ncbi:MAG: DUF177 domain-containing protein [Acidobacteriota bacterium]|nr:DUF177 domain-containing protein [Acidobacteriota bacterium]